MMGDAVEQRAGEALAGEHRGPFLERQVRGHDGGAVLVAPAEDVEQQLASGLRQGHVSELVDDQQADPGELVLVAPCGLPLALGCRRVWRLGYRRGAGWAWIGLGAVTVAVSVVAGLLGPVAIAVYAVVLSLPVWGAWWWLANRN